MEDDIQTFENVEQRVYLKIRDFLRTLNVFLLALALFLKD